MVCFRPPVAALALVHWPPGARPAPCGHHQRARARPLWAMDRASRESGRWNPHRTRAPRRGTRANGRPGRPRGAPAVGRGEPRGCPCPGRFPTATGQDATPSRSRLCCQLPVPLPPASDQPCARPRVGSACGQARGEGAGSPVRSTVARTRVWATVCVHMLGLKLQLEVRLYSSCTGESATAPSYRRQALARA